MRDTADVVAPTVLVLPAFDEDDFAIPGESFSESALPHELEPWLSAYDFDETLDVRGANAPVLLADGGDVALTATGMGKVAAASTVTALCGAPELDLAETRFLSVGVAGGPPSRATLGSVFLADAVVDWDAKHRWSESDAAGDERPIDLLRYRPHDYVHRLDDDLVSGALDAARDVDLVDHPALDAYRERYLDHAAVGEQGGDGAVGEQGGDGAVGEQGGDGAVGEQGGDGAVGDPVVDVGTTLTGDEFWHGATIGEHAQWLCDAYDAGAYCTTQMEDYATATALSRFGYRDRYLSVRAVVNFDRPAPGQTIPESLDEETGGFALDVATTNAFRVGHAIVEAVRDERI